MAKMRRDHGIPLKTLVVGRPPGGIEHVLECSTAVDELKDNHPEDYTALKELKYYHPEDYTGLGEFVEDLRVGCPAKILGWGTENDIFNVWSTVGTPGPVSPNVKSVLLG